MKYKQALEHVITFLQQFEPKLTVSVYDYFDGDPKNRTKRPWCGIRVAEVSFSNANGGCSFMQSDLPHGLAVCAQTERCILAAIEDWDMTSTEETMGDGAEEFERLRYLLTTNTP